MFQQAPVVRLFTDNYSDKTRAVKLLAGTEIGFVLHNKGEFVEGS